MSPSIFQNTTYGCALGKKCRPFRARKLCGAKPYDRYIFGRFFCATGTTSHGLMRSGLLDSGGALDTLPPRLWWPGRAVARLRQTGNTGVNPGRPRRCDQALRPAVSKPLRPALRCGLREKACSRQSLGVRRPTKVAEQAFLARAGWQARVRRSDPLQSDIRLFPESRLGVVGRLRVRTRMEARAWSARDLPGPRRCAWIRVHFILVRRHRVAA